MDVKGKTTKGHRNIDGIDFIVRHVGRFFIVSGKKGIGIICPMSISEAEKNTI